MSVRFESPRPSRDGLARRDSRDPAGAWPERGPRAGCARWSRINRRCAPLDTPGAWALGASAALCSDTPMTRPQPSHSSRTAASPPFSQDCRGARPRRRSTTRCCPPTSVRRVPRTTSPRSCASGRQRLARRAAAHPERSASGGGGGYSSGAAYGFGISTSLFRGPGLAAFWQRSVLIASRGSGVAGQMDRAGHGPRTPLFSTAARHRCSGIRLPAGCRSPRTSQAA